MALLKYCNRNGCNKLVPWGVRYCKRTHRKQDSGEPGERHKEYDAHCRNQNGKRLFIIKSEWKATLEYYKRYRHRYIFIHQWKAGVVPLIQYIILLS